MQIDNQLVQSVGVIATAIGVGLAAYQLRRSKLQSITTFEDDLAKEYRVLSKGLPTKVFFGESLSPAEMEPLLDDFYYYFDLCNSQIFFRQTGRVSKKTWEFWAAGMQQNLSLAAFSMAWSQIGPRVGTIFHEYRHCIESNFQSDPRDWR
jgi:hypothetical protein